MVEQIRQGIYGEYEVEVTPQKVAPIIQAGSRARTGWFPLSLLAVLQYDDARGTFKTVKETKKGKNKYVAVRRTNILHLLKHPSLVSKCSSICVTAGQVLGVLLIGSFVIPMLQYFWYVRED